MESLGGYRLVRRLGAGARSDVWLGSDGSDTVAIKVFREGAGREHIDSEIEALGRASNRHLLRLDDLAMSPDGVPCLILQRLTQWSLGRVLGMARPSDGAAVTILAPLSLAVAELHRVGVAHGRVRCSSVLFDGAGAPVLTSFGNADLFGTMPSESSSFSLPPVQLSQQLGVVEDIEALVKMCRSVVEPESEIERWLSTSRDRDPAVFPLELADRLFASARAAPVHFVTHTTEVAPTEIPSRVSDRPRRVGSVAMVDSGAVSDASEQQSRPGAAVTSAAALLHLPDGMVNSWFSGMSTALERGPVSTMVRRLKDALRPVRKPVWVVAGVVAVAVVAFAMVLPSGDRGDAVQAQLSSPSPTPSFAIPVAPPEITGDDPLAAATALLDARAECFTARSVLCFDSVDQRGSAAMDSDSTQVRLLQDGGAVDGSLLVASGTEGEGSGSRYIVLVERLGDSVLLAVSFDGVGGADDAETTDVAGNAATAGATLSLLLIKSDEGWRIRDIVPLVDSPY